MEHSLLQEVSNKTLSSYLSKMAFGQDLYFLKMFPWKYSPSIDFQILLAASGNRVASSVCSWNSSAPEATRKTVGRLSGSIPPVKILRTMTEIDLNLYYQIKALNPGSTDIFDLVFKDTDFVMDSALARLEWMALQALSRFAITLTKDNNQGIITEEDISFQLASANKEVVAGAGQHWTVANAATSTCVQDITTIVAEMRNAGVRCKYILMNRSKFIAFASSAEVSDLCYAMLVAQGVTSPGIALGIDDVNKALVAQGLPQIIIVDSVVDIEDSEHEITGTDCWLESDADRYVTFIPELIVGSMLFTISPEERVRPKQVTQSKVQNILVSKWSTLNPTCEFTKSEIGAFPIIDRIAEIWSLDTESNTSWGA